MDSRRWGRKVAGPPLGRRSPPASGDRTFKFAWIIIKLSNMKHEVKMSKKLLIFRISCCWFVYERGESTFLGLFLSDFSCILFGQKFFVTFRPIEMKLRFLIENELSFPMVLKFWRSDENCRKYGVLAVFFYSGGMFSHSLALYTVFISICKTIWSF